VVVFETAGISGLDQGKDFIKRVIGLGGERLEIVPDNPGWNPEGSDIIRSGGHIYINGKPIKEPAKVAERAYYPAGEYGSTEITIPPERYFMLGDNALNSRDSRFWGFVPRENVIGKAVAIYWPPNRIGLVR
jgi:signal peptidase I